MANAKKREKLYAKGEENEEVFLVDENSVDDKEQSEICYTCRGPCAKRNDGRYR